MADQYKQSPSSTSGTLREVRDDVADSFVRRREGEVTPERLGLEEIERTVDDLALRPAEVAVGVVDPLVRDHTKGDEHRPEHVDGGEHRLAPRHRSAFRATLRVRDYREGHTGRQEQRKEEGDVYAWPFEDVDRDQHSGCLPCSLRM